MIVLHINLQKLRLEKKYKPKDMAKWLFISTAQYYRIENGYCKLTYEMAVKIAMILDTTPDKLFLVEFKKNI